MTAAMGCCWGFFGGGGSFFLWPVLFCLGLYVACFGVFSLGVGPGHFICTAPYYAESSTAFFPVSLGKDNKFSHLISDSCSYIIMPSVGIILIQAFIYWRLIYSPINQIGSPQGFSQIKILNVEKYAFNIQHDIACSVFPCDSHSWTCDTSLTKWMSLLCKKTLDSPPVRFCQQRTQREAMQTDSISWNIVKQFWSSFSNLIFTFDVLIYCGADSKFYLYFLFCLVLIK